MEGINRIPYPSDNRLERSFSTVYFVLANRFTPVDAWEDDAVARAAARAKVAAE